MTTHSFLRALRGLPGIFCILVLSLLAACGGGGGGGTGTTPAQANDTRRFPIDQAFRTLVTRGFTATGSVRGTVDGAPATGNASVSWAAASSATFEGRHVVQSTVTESMYAGGPGGNASVNTVTNQYFNDNMHPVGSVDADGSAYTVVDVFNGWPSAAKTGDSGVLGQATVYSDPSKSTVTGRQELRYAVEANDAESAMLVLTTIESDSRQRVVLTQHERYAVTSTGGITLVSVTGIMSEDDFSANLTLNYGFFALNPAPAAPSTPVMPPVTPVAPQPVIPNDPPTPLPVLGASMTLQADSAHSGHLSFGRPLNFPSTVSWQVTFGGHLSYPIVAEGKVFVIEGGKPSPGGNSRGTTLHALDINTGNVAWGPVAIPGDANWSGHAYGDGKIFVLNREGLLQSFDAATGAPGWQTRVVTWAGSPPTLKNGILYLSGVTREDMFTAYSSVHAVLATDGQVMWSKVVKGSEHATPTVTNEGVFLSYENGSVFKLAPATGELLWKSERQEDNWTGTGGLTPVYADGKLYVRDVKNRNVVYDSTTGKALGSFSATLIPAVGKSTSFNPFNASLRAFDNATQEFRWVLDMHELVTPPLVIDSTVFVASTSGAVFALDAGTATELWRGSTGAATYPTFEPFTSSQPHTGLGAGAGYLFVPSGNVLTAWQF